MSREPCFLTVEHALAIHRRTIKEFGGTPAIRDRGLLESAVHMPQAKFGGVYLHAGLPAMAAAYHFHLCKNHALGDGNKRTALAAAEVFLRLNSRILKATDADLERITLGVAEGTVSKKELTAFFRRHARRAASGSKP